MRLMDLVGDVVAEDAPVGALQLAKAVLGFAFFALVFLAFAGGALLFGGELAGGMPGEFGLCVEPGFEEGYLLVGAIAEDDGYDRAEDDQDVADEWAWADLEQCGERFHGRPLFVAWNYRHVVWNGATRPGVDALAGQELLPVHKAPRQLWWADVVRFWCPGRVCRGWLDQAGGCPVAGGSDELR